MVLNKTSWEIVAYVQVIFFAILIIALVVVVIHKWTKGLDRKIIKNSVGYFGLFTACKVAGGVCGIVLLHQKHYSSGLTIATYVLDNASFGMLIKCMLPFLELMITEEEPEALKGNPFNYDSGSEDQKIDIRKMGIGSVVESTLKQNLPFRLLTLLILASMICTIVGTSSISTDGTSSGASSPLKAGTVLFLVLIVLMAALIVWGHNLNKNHQLMAKILFASIAFYIVRAVYSILSAFAGIDFEDPSKYLLIFGEYQYYTFMGFIEECIISTILLINLIVFRSQPAIL